MSRAGPSTRPAARARPPGPLRGGCDLPEVAVQVAELPEVPAPLRLLRFYEAAARPYVLSADDRWLLQIFAPHRLAATIRELAAAQPRPQHVSPAPADDRAAVICGCDAKLARYQATLDAGADPVTVAAWAKTVTAERAAALARAAARPAAHGRPLTEDAIQQIIQCSQPLSPPGTSATPSERQPHSPAPELSCSDQ